MYYYAFTYTIVVGTELIGSGPLGVEHKEARSLSDLKSYVKANTQDFPKNAVVQIHALEHLSKEEWQSRFGGKISS